jgi:anti-sigma factor RsiW
MKNPCLDEGILQSYYDGELAPERLEYVASHLASCAACSELAREVENEIEMATSAFAAEMSLPVPTERLRARLDEAITGMNVQPAAISEGSASRVRAWFSSLASAFNLAPQRAIGFASLAVFFVLAAVVGGIVMRQHDSNTSFVAANVSQKDMTDLSFTGREVPEVTQTPVSVQRTQFVAHRPTSKAGQPKALTPVETAPPTALPGEKNYLQAIALLTDAIEANGETSLKPTLLADYKQNLAVVDNAITATQRTARTNPKSADAAEMLYAAYQSKLELLSAVAEQSQPFVAHR